MARRFTCSCQGEEHDYGNSRNLKQHLKTATHKRFTDPVFAEAERQRKKDARPTISCCVKGCDYTSSDACNLRRHEVGCKVKAESGDAKSGDAGGHRENAGRKIQDDVEWHKVAQTIRVGRPKYDLWRLDLCRNGETYVP